MGKGKGKKGRRFEELDEVEEIEEVDSDDSDDEYDDDVRHRPKSRGPLIALVVLAIVGIMILVLYFTVISPSGVMGIYPGFPRENDDKTGIIIQADVALKGSGNAEGTGELKIKYEGTTTYSSKISINKGLARKEVMYNNFVEGNGEYEIFISYEDKEESTKYTIDWVVEDAEVSLAAMPKSESEKLSVGEQPYLNVTVETTYFDERTNTFANLGDVRHVSIDIELFYDEDNSLVTTDSIDIQPGRTSTAWKSFTYSKAGNYTAKVSIINDDVKSDYGAIEASGTELINTAPIANGTLVDADGYVSLSQFNDDGMANFDASLTFDPDGTIIRYQWDFDDESDDNVVQTTEPQVSHKYTIAKTYYVTLTVMDDTSPAPGIDVGTIRVEVRRV